VVYRTRASCIAAATAALAGAPLALWSNQTNPDTTLSFDIMVDILLMAVIGGLRQKHQPGKCCVLDTGRSRLDSLSMKRCEINRDRRNILLSAEIFSWHLKSPTSESISRQGKMNFFIFANAKIAFHSLPSLWPRR